MDDIENKIRDTLVDALKSYFKSDHITKSNGQEEMEQDMDEFTDEVPEKGNLEAENTSQMNKTDPVTNSVNPEGEFDEGLTKLDISNLFQFPDATASNKSFSLSFNIGMKNPQPDIKMPDEIDPKIMDDFMNFMGLLGVTPDDIAETIDEMAKMGMQDIIDDGENLKKDIPVQKEIFHDIFEDGDKISIIAEMPGMEKDEIELHVAQKEIELNGTIINLPAPIDPDNVKAKLNNGILEIKLQKIAE